MRGKIYKRDGSPYYWVKFQDPSGKWYRETTKSKRKVEAEKYLRKRENEVSSGPVKGLYLTTKWEHLVKLIEDNYKSKGNRSWDSTTNNSVNNLKKYFAKFRPVDITTADIMAYKNKRTLIDEMKVDTINRELGVLRRMLRLAVEADLLSKAPKVELFKDTNIREGYITKEEYDKLQNAAPLHFHPVIVFLYNTGCRIGEVLNLRWDHYDFDRHTFFLSSKEVKEKKSREFMVNNEVRKVLERLWRLRDQKREKNYIFTNSSGTGKIGNPYPIWYSMVDRAEVGKKIPHDFRRTWAVNGLRAGIPESILMKLGGWHSIKTFRRYALVREEDQRLGVELMEKYLNK